MEQEKERTSKNAINIGAVVPIKVDLGSVVSPLTRIAHMIDKNPKKLNKFLPAPVRGAEFN